MANSIKMAGQMALGRERLYNFSVSLNSGDKLLKAIQKKRQRKFHLFTAPIKKALQIFTALKVRGKWVHAQFKQHYMVSQSAAYAMILS